MQAKLLLNFPGLFSYVFMLLCVLIRVWCSLTFFTKLPFDSKSIFQFLGLTQFQFCTISLFLGFDISDKCFKSAVK
jgi:hypothetical protein